MKYKDLSEQEKMSSIPEIRGIQRDLSELRGAFCSKKFSEMESALKVIAVWAGQDEFSFQTRKTAMKDIHDKAMKALGRDISS